MASGRVVKRTIVVRSFGACALFKWWSAAVTRDVVLNMDEFGRHALDSFVREHNGSQSAAAHAIVYFLADLDSGRVAGRLDEAL
jgi:hypothetical protein